MNVTKILDTIVKKIIITKNKFIRNNNYNKNI